MVGLLRNNWIPVACTGFVLLNTAMAVQGQFWPNLLPLVLLAGWALVAAPEKLLLFIVFATPLSINLEELDIGGIGVALPTEPLMVALMLLFLLKMALEGGVVSPRVWRHPVTIAILVQVAWMAVCVVPSTMVLVSAKYLAARLWFVCTMYFMATRLFRSPGNIHRFFWYFVAGLSIVVVYTISQHARYGFAEDPAHWVMSPFFKDHTSYGAVLSMLLPFAVAAVFLPGYSRGRKAWALLVLAVLATGLLFSYTRAAWLGIAGAAAVFLVMRLRIPAWAIGIAALVAGSLAWANQERITIALERNRAESHDDLAQHVSSISNIRSDASNLERINRWNSALRMFKEKPVTGWGPGTYMFQYAPFQASRDRTIISTNFGLVGNAHSEYLGPLAEQGLPGLVAVLLVIGSITWTAVRLWSKLPDGADRRLVGAAFLGLVTYFIHGALNNFLDLDKASVPFWGLAAMIVVLDLKHKDQPAQRKAQVSSAMSSK